LSDGVRVTALFVIINKIAKANNPEKKMSHDHFGKLNLRSIK